VKPAQLASLLQDFYRERLEALVRHEAAARRMADYDVNNTYQYVIAREETHLAWLADAIRDLGGEVADAPAPSAAETAAAPSEQALAADDAKRAQQELDRWSALVDQVSNARHHKVLTVVLGEMREHMRFFEQAAARRTDLLGRHPAEAGRGKVLSTRWIE
jgi:hypothetical protein